jgi:hypothetical protein
MSKEKKKKIKIPKSVLDLKLSPKKYAKKHNIKLTGKGMSKKDKKHNLKRLQKEYCESAISGLNKAVKILAENSNNDGKKIRKVKEATDNIITRPEVMKKMAKLYKKDPDQYPNMIFLPNMIMNTILYYSQETLTEEEKAIADSMDKESLIEFCESILKKRIKKYKKFGLSDTISYQLATVIPTTKLFKGSNQWYKRLISQLYDIAKTEEVDIDTILKAITKLDKDKYISKKDFYEGFYSTFIMRRSSNKNKSFTDYQKDLHEGLTERALNYLEDLKPKKLRSVLRDYIKARKFAESVKADSKRVINFTDYANSNSAYTNIKNVVKELIEDNPNNELYLAE